MAYSLHQKMWLINKYGGNYPIEYPYNPEISSTLFKIEFSVLLLVVPIFLPFGSDPTNGCDRY